MTLERLWAGWRSDYVGGLLGAETDHEDESEHACVLCRVIADGSGVVWRGEEVAVIVNAFPYTTGHMMAVPVRHLADLEDLTTAESAGVWAATTDAVRALKGAYRPDGFNVGVNLGRRGGAGVPGHLHVHVLPRWEGDTNFMTTVAETRVLPQSLPETLDRLKAAWPS